MTIEPTAAELAAMQASSRDPEIARAGQAMLAGDPASAEALLRAVLARRPDDFVALRMLGEIAASFGLLSDGEALFRRALALAPGFAYARLHLALVLHDQERSGEALAEFAAIAGSALLDHAEIKAVHADALGRVGDYAEAIRLYREILAADPANLEIWTRLAFLLKTIGATDDAVAACRSALAVRPEYGEAWWLLADFKTFEFSDQDIEALSAALAAPVLSPDDRLRLHFALGKALEDRRQSAASFDQYRSGNAIRAAQLANDRTGSRGSSIAAKRLFTARIPRRAGGAGRSRARPDLHRRHAALGLHSGRADPRQSSADRGHVGAARHLRDREEPRAGPAARARCNAVSRPARRAPGRPAARSSAQLYLQRTRIQRKTDRPLFIDKMPNNWMQVGFIRLILPNAKIIDTRRNPLACGFSNFKQLYAQGQEFSYDLAHFGRHYADYVRLMAHFDAVAPGAVHRIIHDRLVADPEAEIRRLLDFVGVPFDAACLRFHETRRPVRTASAEQVRQPIRKNTVDEWRAFEAGLARSRRRERPPLNIGTTLSRPTDCRSGRAPVRPSRRPACCRSAPSPRASRRRSA